MGKVLAIDYGEKRVGIALSDEEERIAFPFKTLENKGDQEVIKAVQAIAQSKGVAKITVGLPIGLRGEKTAQVKRIQSFIQKLQNSIDLPIDLEDERLTSQLAKRLLKDNPQKKARNKNAIDKQAAVIILQGYLDRKRGRDADVSPAQVK